jgi:hypothetical protein
MTTLARTSRNCKQQTRPLVREGTPHQYSRNCLTVIKIWTRAPDGYFIPRKIGRLTVGRNITLTLESEKQEAGVGWPPACEYSMEAGERPLSEDVTKQRTGDRDTNFLMIVICKV